MRRTWISVLAVIAVAAILIGINMFADTPAGQCAARPDAAAPLHAVGRHAQMLGGPEGADHAAALLFARARRTHSGLRRLRRPRARDAAGIRRALERQDQARILRPRAVQRHRRPRAWPTVSRACPIDQSGDQVYFGLAGTNLLDDERTIAFFQPDREPFLEYDLTRLIYELSNPTRPVVGVMSSLPLDGDPRMMMMMRGSRAARRALGLDAATAADLDVKKVPTDAQVIDPDIQVLLVAQAQNLSDNTLYAIDQFVMRGGRLMAMVDPYSEAEAAAPTQNGMPPENTSSDLKKLFDAWGITFDPANVVGDLKGAWRVRASRAIACRRSTTSPGSTSATASPTTTRRPPSYPGDGGHGRRDRQERRRRIEFTPLLSDPKQSGPIPVDKVEECPIPAKILADFKPQGGPRVIAARVRGVLKSAFTGPPPLAAGPEAAGRISRPTSPRPRRRLTWWWWATPTSWPTATGCGCRISSASSSRRRSATTGRSSPT